ncbi:hypothetical protein BGZ74_008133, partial [Mortierella antarctica]
MNRFKAGMERSTPRGLNPTIQSVFSRASGDVSTEDVDDMEEEQEDEMSHCSNSRSKSGLGPVSYTTTSWNGLWCAAKVWAIVFMRVSPVRNQSSGGCWSDDGDVGEDVGQGIETRKSANWAPLSKMSSLVVVAGSVEVDGGVLMWVNPTPLTAVRVAPVRQYT